MEPRKEWGEKRTGLPPPALMEKFFSPSYLLLDFFEKSYPTIHPSGNLKHTHTHTHTYTIKRKTNQPTKTTPYKFEGKLNLLIQRFEGL